MLLKLSLLPQAKLCKLHNFLFCCRYQGYNTTNIPTHREIQECLVDIGDKPTTFIGSRQWIGSTEVMFCLETLLGVQSRIIFANTGAELQSYTPELIHHFQTHGSPIMIGEFFFSYREK